jgi:hypothetical protein
MNSGGRSQGVLTEPPRDLLQRLLFEVAQMKNAAKRQTGVVIEDSRRKSEIGVANRERASQEWESR